MESEKPLLSICIPTYNQPEALDRLLANISSQSSAGIEVVVRDDSADDRSEKIAKKWERSIPLRYFHGKKEGVDKALLFLAEEAKGKFLWWFGDDMMEPDTIQRVIGILKTDSDITMVFMDSRQTIDEDGVLKKLGADHYFKDKNHALEDIGDLLGFISMVILRRDKVLTGLDEAAKRVGSAWVSLYLILHVLSQDGRYFFVSHPYIVSNPRDPAKSAWYDGFTVFALNLYHIVMAFRGRFSDRSIKRMLSDNLTGILKGIFVYRAKGYAHGLGSKEPKIGPLLKLYWNYAEFWKYLPLLLVPRTIARFSYKIYKRKI